MAMRSLIRHGIELDIKWLRKSQEEILIRHEIARSKYRFDLWIWRERFGSHQEYTWKSVAKTSYPAENSEPKLSV